MRPLELKIKGLLCYRDEVVIPFETLSQQTSDMCPKLCWDEIRGKRTLLRHRCRQTFCVDNSNKSSLMF